MFSSNRKNNQGKTQKSGSKPFEVFMAAKINEDFRNADKGILLQLDKLLVAVPTGWRVKDLVEHHVGKQHGGIRRAWRAPGQP